ncbi:serine/threonine-protein kinase [Aneurinibacillus danicus]|jgi:serine/threonine protein kinase|uniref:Serine/threonine protein kinase n=1 Tax=Aneurinibacillus danicus TaxID=267746 RepID=A0A511V5K7_9BACL|nr:serine/threonine-protein kinase [Aneurinibacillus danicus]GEN34210.1 serine/threonine protein kinase [Aneurinibacillus danicus]
MAWEQAVPLIERLKVTTDGGNELVRVASVPEELSCVGRGTDAAVFVHANHPRYAFKVYAVGREEKLKDEERAYRMLGENPYFPHFYGKGQNFIVLSYEQGMNLYDCLISGTYIPRSVVKQVDEAIDYARERGLNPRDIHLKNIILQDGEIKLIDVSEYVREGNDRRWEHLKEGYRLFYRFISHKKIPRPVIEFVKKRYEKQKGAGFTVKSFGFSLLQTGGRYLISEREVGKCCAGFRMGKRLQSRFGSRTCRKQV